jgi:hypothetical protein
MKLPLQLTFTKTSFKGMIGFMKAISIIAYMQNRIHFCLQEPMNERQGILRDLSIESAVGDGSKQGIVFVTSVEECRENRTIYSSAINIVFK